MPGWEETRIEVIAQSADTAEHPQMPLAAAAAGAHLMPPLPEIRPVIGTVVDANDVFLRMTGYSKAEVERGELSWQRMTAPEHVPASLEQLDHLAATGRIGPYEKECFVKDGTRRWMLIVGRDIGDGAVCEFCIDITDLKRAEGESSLDRSCRAARLQRGRAAGDSLTSRHRTRRW